MPSVLRKSFFEITDEDFLGPAEPVERDAVFHPAGREKTEDERPQRGQAQRPWRPLGQLDRGSSELAIAAVRLLAVGALLGVIVASVAGARRAGAPDGSAASSAPPDEAEVSGEPDRGSEGLGIERTLRRHRRQARARSASHPSTPRLPAMSRRHVTTRRARDPHVHSASDPDGEPTPARPPALPPLPPARRTEFGFER